MEISFDDAVSKLKNALPDFTAAYNRLVELGPAISGTSYATEWSALKSQADKFVEAVRWVNEKIGGVTDWFSNIFGLDGMHGINGLNRGMGSLGFVPLIPIAWIVGTVSGMLAITAAMWAFVRKVEAAQRSAEVEARARVAAQTGSGDVFTSWDTSQAEVASATGWGSNISQIGSILALGLVAYFILPKLLKNRG